jgi:beta-lactamase class A
LWIAAAGYEEIASGNVSASDVYTVSSSDQVPGTGILNRAEYIGRDVRFSDLLEMMLLYSDNTAANIVTRLIGGIDRVNGYAAEHGYPATQMQRMLGELDPNRENYTSAADTGLFFERLLNDEVVDQETSAQIRDILQRRHANENDQLNFFGRELSSSLTYGHISGLLPNVRHDAGFVYTDAGEPVVVVALLDNLPSEEAGMESIGRAVREVYDQLD